MPTARSKSLIAIVILLVVLALLSGTSFAITQLGFAAGSFRQGRGPGAFAGGGSQGSSASAGASQGAGAPAGSGNSQGGTAGGFQGGNGGNFQGRGGGGGFFSFFSMAGIFRALGLDFQLMSYANIAVAAVSILLLLLGALGLWMQKRWALYLVIVVGFLFLLGSVPGLFFGAGRFTLVRTGLNVLDAACALGVVILSFLPSTRSSVS